MVAVGLGVTILADIVHRPWSLEGTRVEVRDVIEPVLSLDVGVARRLGLAAGISFAAFMAASWRGEGYLLSPAGPGTLRARIANPG